MKSTQDSCAKLGNGVIDSCFTTHCLCRICAIASWCGSYCESCADSNFSERKVWCEDFYPDKYMISYMRKKEEQDSTIIADRVSSKIIEKY